MSASARSAVASLLAALLAAWSGSAAAALPERRAGAGDSAVVVPDTSWVPARLEGRPIRTVRVVSREIFDPLPEGRLRGFYRLANRLHARTRESTIRNLLLFEPGDAWTSERAAESMRRLRELDFLVPQQFDARLVRDSVDVVAHTADTWTTSPEFDYQSSEAARFMTVAFAEGNVLGLGKSLSLTYHEEPTGVTRSVEWNDPALLGTRSRFDFLAAKGSSGTANHLDLGIPFLAPSTPGTVFGDWQTTTAIAHLYARGAEVANLDVRREDTDVMWGKGWQRDGTVMRWIASFHARDRHLGASRPSGPDPVPEDFAGPVEDLRLRRFALGGQWWRPRFIERVGVNRMTRIEDFDVGDQLTLKVGLAPKTLGSTATEGYLLAAAAAGVEAGRSFGMVHASLETRYRRTVRDELQNLSARWVMPLPARQTLVLAALGAAGVRTARDFQLAAGGLSGLRGYPIEELTGQRLLRLNVEDRLGGPELWELVSVGAATFYDAAHMSGEGAEGSGWRHSVGFGLRLGFPRSALNQIVRVDVAIPVQPVRDERHHLVLSVGSSQAF